MKNSNKKGGFDVTKVSDIKRTSIDHPSYEVSDSFGYFRQSGHWPGIWWGWIQANDLLGIRREWHCLWLPRKGKLRVSNIEKLRGTKRNLNSQYFDSQTKVDSRSVAIEDKIGESERLGQWWKCRVRFRRTCTAKCVSNYLTVSYLKILKNI